MTPMEHGTTTYQSLKGLGIQHTISIPSDFNFYPTIQFRFGPTGFCKGRGQRLVIWSHRLSQSQRRLRSIWPGCSRLFFCCVLTETRGLEWLEFTWTWHDINLKWSSERRFTQNVHGNPSMQTSDTFVELNRLLLFGGPVTVNWMSDRVYPGTIQSKCCVTKKQPCESDLNFGIMILFSNLLGLSWLWISYMRPVRSFQDPFQTPWMALPQWGQMPQPGGTVCWEITSSQLNRVVNHGSNFRNWPGRSVIRCQRTHTHTIKTLSY